MEVKSGWSHNIVKTEKDFYFFGNSQNNQFPYELGNEFSTKFISGKKFRLKALDLEYGDLIDFRTQGNKSYFSTAKEHFLFGGDQEKVERIEEIEGR